MPTKQTQGRPPIHLPDDHDPQLSVVCPLCESEMDVSVGLNAADTLWMHEHDCRERLLGSDFTPSWRQDSV